jgi:hypothetical protein
MLCWEHVLYSMEKVWIRVYRTLSFPATMASERVGRWNRLKCYMVVGAKPRCFGMRRESIKFWTQHTARSRETSSYGGRELEDCTVKTRVMPTKDDENWVLKLEITCTSRCYLWEGYDISRYEANSHQESLVHSRSRRREKNSRQSF